MNSEEISIVESHRDKIYPWVKVILSENEVDNSPVQIKFSGKDSPIKKDWLGDLFILYVADMGDRFQVVFERDLPESITEEMFHEIALENLARDVEYKIMTTNFGAQGLVAGGDHEAGSICLPGIWEYISTQVDDNVIIAIPAKDIIMFAPESQTDIISNLKIFVHEIFKDGERLLTRNIFKYDKKTAEWSIIDTVSFGD